MMEVSIENKKNYSNNQDNVVLALVLLEKLGFDDTVR